MTLNLSNKTQVEVKDIFGYTEFIQGVQREVLKITFTPNTSLEEIRTLFKNKENLVELQTITEEGEDTVTEFLGEHYSIYLGCGNEFIETPVAPGTLSEPQREEQNYVKIAQLTYIEAKLAELGVM